MKKIRMSWKRDWKEIAARFLFLTLILSIVYASVRIYQAPAGISTEAHVKVKSDYVLMLLQCLLGLIVMSIPSFVERKWSIDIPNRMEIMFYIFLYCAIYLGEVRNFYYLIPYWDTVLHAFSGAMLGALGFSLVIFLNESERLDISLSPFFIALFAFSFALAAGAVWEIYEFLADGLMSLNMQKFALEDGTILIGRDAVSDTMKDLITDGVSALGMSIFGYFSISRRKAVRGEAVSKDGVS